MAKKYDLTGKAWIGAGYPLTMEVEILAIRKKIEKKEVHKSANRTLVVAAYNEMRGRQGQTERTMDCGSCMRDMNRQLNIWLKLYDQRTASQKKAVAGSGSHVEDLTLTDIVAGHTVDDSLVPISDRVKAIEKMDYYQLKDEIPNLPVEAQERLKIKSKGRPMPAKSDIIEELLKLA